MSVGFRQNNSTFKKVKVPSVRKIWLPKQKTWDYELTKEPNWKPIGNGFVSKNDLEKQISDDWIDSDILIGYGQIQRLKIDIKNINDNLFDDNPFKQKVNILKYINILTIEYFYNYLIDKYKNSNKSVMYINTKLEDIYNIKTSMKRLKNREYIELPKHISDFNQKTHGFINYWVFKDIIIFKN